MRRRILMMVMILAWGLMPVLGQETTCPDEIPQENGRRCVSLFDQSVVTITKMHGEQALFLNPQVTISLSIKGNDGEIFRVYVPNNTSWDVINPADGKCPLMVVGIAAPNDTQSNLLYEDLPANGPSLTRGLFTFCARSDDTNLPRDPRIQAGALNAFGFPKGDFDGTISPMTSFPKQLQNVIQRSQDGTACSGSSGPLTWRSFATQLAVLIALNPRPAPYTTWQLYAQQMQNIGFLNDYTGIYCLLDEDAPQPEAILSADKTEGNAPLTVAFSDDSTGDIQGYA